MQQQCPGKGQGGLAVIEPVEVFTLLGISGSQAPAGVLILVEPLMRDRTGWGESRSPSRKQSGMQQRLSRKKGKKKQTLGIHTVCAKGCFK
ncbi:hypothetical protein A8C75_19215 [Marinobacterium aestuarii]|uniref:Uncharacterized protein n=1 Tax=Marinobacterium aestuarii TaxID=1821621 RepID=A0A1A9F3P8_9GAMM|nr:hypothetical protein A8C75_19215 [Marinobacterium aestuarii]